MNYVDDSIERVLLSKEDLEKITDNVADEINNEFGDEPVILVIILKGSITFATDLMRKLKMPVTIDFMKASSYGSGTVSSHVVNISLDLKTDIKDKNVIVVEDIVDTGRTLHKLKTILNERGAKTVKICTLLDKPDRRAVDIKTDYVGAVIPDEFVVGYGLDYNEYYRELPFIGILAKHVYE